DKALLASFDQVPLYQKYVTDEANFGTHQGVKGREFKRVMVILDDDEARGNWFNFEKLLGVKGHTATDVQRMNEGKENSMDRTLRLIYVTCSRTEESLASVTYTTHPELFAKNTVDMKWFQKEEIEFIN